VRAGPPLKVLVLHTLPPSVALEGRDSGEFDLSTAASGLAQILPNAVVAGVRGEVRELLALLDATQPDVVFNACEAPLGRTDFEAHAAALFEWLGIRFTGCGSETLALCRRKDRTRAVLAVRGVPVPRSGVFPCIVKPADEDGSAYLDARSICENAAEVERAKARLPGSAIVEEFLPGREFAVAVWGNREPQFLSIGETHFLGDLRLITYAAKWDPDSADFANSPLDYQSELDDRLREALHATAAGAWRAVGARGYIRVDIRLDAAGSPFVLDVNPNPELGPGVGICRAAAEAGWTWERFVRQQVEWACT
jgi:D-alanine-D-alanine ligase